MDAPWRIELLGWLRATQGGRIISRFRSHQAGVLLAYLTYFRHHSHPRGALIELLWPECDPQAARLRFRVVLASLRRQLEPLDVPRSAVLAATREFIQLNPAACHTDVAEFEAALQSAARTGSEAERVRWLSEAAELYRGELLPGYFEPWVLPERQRLAELYLQALGRLTTLLEQAGDLAGALQYARRAVAADPLREETHLGLIRLLTAVGQSEAAYRQHEEMERLLAPELGGAPARALSPRFADTMGQWKAVSGESSPTFTPSPPAGESVRPETQALPPRPSVSTGTVTFLMAEIGATTGRESGWELMRALLYSYGGQEVSRGEETPCGVFGRASAALAAAVAGQQALAGRAEAGLLPSGPPVPGSGHGDGAASMVRMALHVGEVEPGDELRRSPAMRHATRLLLAAHPGQILLSEATAALLRSGLPPELQLVDLGLYRLAQGAQPERLFQVDDPEQSPKEFPAPNAAPAPAGSLPLQFTRFFGRESEVAQLCELLGSGTTWTWRHGEEHREDDTESAVSVPPRAPGRREDPVTIPRLVTLTGPGGSGKTRLALEVAARLRDVFRGEAPPPGPRSARHPRNLRPLTNSPPTKGVGPGPGPGEAVVAGGPWFVPLADLTDPRLILDKVLDRLNLTRSPRLEPLEQIAAFLSPRPSLLLLDNFEHLVTGGAPILQALRQRLPTLVVLVTSRQRLDLPGEREFPVAPLPVPSVTGSQWSVASRSPDDGLSLATDYSSLTTVASVRLFVDRAQAARPDFQVTAANAAVVATLCRRLEGLPLAIELAAAQARVLTPAQMLARLERRFDLLSSRRRPAEPRHRSLRTALDWSYRLLSPELQRFFARLSVFRGGFPVEAAAAVCQEARALDYLEQLRECSLVMPEEGEGEMRFRLLETLREYGAEQLTAEERVDRARRHAGYYLALAEKASIGLPGGEEPEWLERLAAEHDNFRAALDWAVAAGVSPEGYQDAQVGLQIGGSLAHFWMVRGYWAEGRKRLTELLALPAAPERTAARAKALQGAAWLARIQDDLAAARALFGESLIVHQQLGNKDGIATALSGLGLVAAAQGNRDTARSCYEQSLAMRRETGDRRGIAASLGELGNLAFRQGDMSAARSLHEESLATFREVDSKGGIAWSLTRLGNVALCQEDLAAARSCYEEALAVFRRCDDRYGIASSLTSLGGVVRLQGDGDLARFLLEESLTLWRELEVGLGAAGSLTGLGGVALSQGQLDQARRHFGESLAINRRLSSKPGVMNCLEGLAEAAAAERQPERAAWLFGAADALHRALGHPPSPRLQAERDQQLALLKETLGEGGFAAAWAAGQAVTWEQAAAAALGEAAPPDPGAGQPVAPPPPSPGPEVPYRLPQGDLTPQEWERIAPLLPASAGRRGRPYQDHRRVINGILWVLRTGGAWRDLPPQYGPWHTCHNRYRRWRREGLWDRIIQAVQPPAEPGARGTAQEPDRQIS